MVETALGPCVVSSAVSRPKNTTKMMTMMTLDQTRGMFDLSSQVFPKHPVHGDNAPDDLDRSEAVRAEPVGHTDEQAQQQDHSQEGEGGWRDGSRWIVRCEQRQDYLPSWYLYGACADIIIL